MIRPEILEGRHQATRQVAQWFTHGHLPAGKPRNAAGNCAVLAVKMIEQLDDGLELTAGLRKLLEAKDCFVRAAIESGE